MEVPDSDKLNLTSFALDDLKLSDDETCLAAVRMFLDLDLISTFKIPYKVNCYFLVYQSHCLIAEMSGCRVNFSL